MFNSQWKILLGLYGVLILASLPLIFRWIPPNRWYGFRLPGARLNPVVWYHINEMGGKFFAVAMGVCILVNLLIFWKGSSEIQNHLGWINAGLILLSFWLVSLELYGYLPW